MFEIGSTLRQSRTRQGLELRDAERETRIRTKYLAPLEEERSDQLPAEAYAKAFLRTYADFLGLDSELFVAELHSRIVASRPPPVRAGNSFRSPSGRVVGVDVLGAAAPARVARAAGAVGAG